MYFFTFVYRKQSLTAIVLSMFILSFIIMIVCGLFEWERIAPGLCYRLFISVLPVGDPIIKLRWDGIT